MKRALSLAAGALLVLTSCAKTKHEPITVLAASSLTQPFTELGRLFHDKTSTEVRFSFAASSTLARQIADGETADVFASAAEKDMQGLVDKHLVATPEDFASNTLEIAVPKDNPKHVVSLADLGAAGTTVVLCASTVPCGRLADAVLGRAKVTVHGASREDNVKAVLSKISLGEADAGIVYVSDITSAPASVRGIPIPSAANAVTTYPIAVVSESRQSSEARDFASFVLSATGRSTLQRYGFNVP